MKSALVPAPGSQPSSDSATYGRGTSHSIVGSKMTFAVPSYAWTDETGMTHSTTFAPPMTPLVPQG